MKITKTFFFTFIAQLLFVFLAIGQPSQKLIEVQVSPTNTDWTYQLGEKANFEVQVLKNGQLIPNVKIRYEIGAEQLPATIKLEKLLKKGETIIKVKKNVLVIFMSFYLFDKLFLNIINSIYSSGNENAT